MQKEVRKQVASYLALVTHSPSTILTIVYFLCVLLQTHILLGSYAYAYTNETSVANLQGLILTLAGIRQTSQSRD